MSGANVFIDRSQFPENVRRDLLESLHARAINHKFHYESYKQAAKWRALHEAHSPSRTDASCRQIYADAFAAAAAATESASVHLIGLGCGGGQKEARLLEALAEEARRLIYTASDVSLALVLMAREASLPFVEEKNCQAVICDLATEDGLAGAVNGFDTDSPRLVTLFGIVPNFEPGPLLSRVARVLRKNDRLLLSANLAPGNDYAAGAHAVLPQYDNGLTRDWLKTFLLDLGFEDADGELTFAVEEDAQNLWRIAAHFELRQDRSVQVYDEAISFRAGQRIRVFFSYRHTPDTLRARLAEHGLGIFQQWLSEGPEEGVFLAGLAK